jgi:hypothetical protein
MKRGTRIVVTLPNGEEATARFVSETVGEIMVQLFGEHHATTTDKGYRILPQSAVQVDEVYAPFGRKS